MIKFRHLKGKFPPFCTVTKHLLWLEVLQFFLSFYHTAPCFLEKDKAPNTTQAIIAILTNSYRSHHHCCIEPVGPIQFSCQTSVRRTCEESLIKCKWKQHHCCICMRTPVEFGGVTSTTGLGIEGFRKEELRDWEISPVNVLQSPLVLLLLLAGTAVAAGSAVAAWIAVAAGWNCWIVVRLQWSIRCCWMLLAGWLDSRCCLLDWIWIVWWSLFLPSGGTVSVLCLV